MNVFSGTWNWLLDENNRGAIALVGTALAAVVTAGWVVFKFVRPRGDTPENTEAPDRTTDFIEGGTVQRVQEMHGGSLTFNSSPTAEQMQPFIQGLLVWQR